MPRVHPVLMPFTCLVAMVCALAVPAFAAGHASTGLGAGDAPLDAVAAAQLPEMQEVALEALPAETAAGSCRTAARVDGLGLACRTDDGLFRVVVAPGVTVETHGGDAPATEVRELEAAHLPNSQAAIDGADASDVACVAGVNDK
ncbi:MAG: hypothetical protein JWM25_1742, partial [Thermoleophilia bacterium]|nr:hypothetical protein [Thermoleophilia bacterium]